jgi:hypothetical protein
VREKRGKKEKVRFGGEGDLYGLGMGGRTRVWPVVWEVPILPSSLAGRQETGQEVERCEMEGSIVAMTAGPPPKLMPGVGRATNKGSGFSRNDPHPFELLVLERLSISGLLQAIDTGTAHYLPFRPSTTPRSRATRAGKGPLSYTNEQISGSLVEENHCSNGDCPV